jgi:hypothetical protein
MRQLTLDDADRQARIDRLSRSLNRWREQETDRLFPEEYRRYCEILAHLEAGEAYTVTVFDPSDIYDKSAAVQEIGAAAGSALASMSRRSIGMMERSRRGSQ